MEAEAPIPVLPDTVKVDKLEAPETERVEVPNDPNIPADEALTEAPTPILPPTVNAPVILPVPQTSRLYPAEVPPIPTLPEIKAPFTGDVIPKALPILMAPATERALFDVVVPIPTLPVEVMTVAEEPELIWNIWDGEVMPIPTSPAEVTVKPEVPDPDVVKERALDEGDHSPVFWDEVKEYAGAVAEPLMP